MRYNINRSVLPNESKMYDEMINCECCGRNFLFVTSKLQRDKEMCHECLRAVYEAKRRG